MALNMCQSFLLSLIFLAISYLANRAEYKCNRLSTIQGKIILSFNFQLKYLLFNWQKYMFKARGSGRFISGKHGSTSVVHIQDSSNPPALPGLGLGVAGASGWVPFLSGLPKFSREVV